MESTIFKEKYVKLILEPFINKRLRMNSNVKDLNYKIPFMLETSMESNFYVEFNSFGIKFVLKNNYYLNQNIQESFRKSLLDMEIYPMQLDNLKEENDVFLKIIDKINEKISIQIAFTYYNQIKSLTVDDKRFILNGVSFFIV